MADLDLAARIVANGVTLELEQAPYSLAATSRAAAQVSHRKHEVSSPYVEGSFATHAVRENIVEPVDVYIETTNRRLMRDALDALELALSFPNWTLQWDWRGLNGVRETWTCFAASYTIETSQPLMVATMALVRAQVPRLPTKTAVNL